MEKYSVLMSVYCKENPEYYRKSLESMIKQTAKPDEIVIVHDGPLTEELEEVSKEYKSNYPELINIIRSEKNVGLGRALKLGMENCRNSLIARMDTDDISAETRCEEQLKIFSNDTRVSVVGSNIAEFIGDSTNRIGVRRVPSENHQVERYIKKRCPFNHMSVMLRKGDVIDSGGYRDWHFNEDYYLWIRMFMNGYRFCNIDKELVLVRVNEDMYKRRGGAKYFSSEKKLQRFMLDNKVIKLHEYIANVSVRFVVQVLLPNRTRQFMFKKFFRE